MRFLTVAIRAIAANAYGQGPISIPSGPCPYNDAGTVYLWRGYHVACFGSSPSICLRYFALFVTALVVVVLAQSAVAFEARFGDSRDKIRGYYTDSRREGGLSDNRRLGTTGRGEPAFPPQNRLLGESAFAVMVCHPCAKPRPASGRRS